jgi:hypothetical protein
MTDVDDLQYSDFDPDDLEEISRLADEFDTPTTLEVVAIEDYEPPHGLRLPAGSQPVRHHTSPPSCTLPPRKTRCTDTDQRLARREVTVEP